MFIIENESQPVPRLYKIKPIHTHIPNKKSNQALIHLCTYKHCENILFFMFATKALKSPLFLWAADFGRWPTILL